jgi:hypothetical protein
MNDPLYIGQPDPRALKFSLTVQTLKHAEQLLSIFRIEAGPIVANEDHCPATSILYPTDFDSGLDASAGELHRIGNQIDQHHSQQGTVTPYCRQWRSFPDDIPSFGFGLQIAHRLPDQLVKIDVSLLQFRAPDPGEGKEVLNQSPHPCRGLENRFQMVATVFRKRWAFLLLEQSYKAHDVPQWRSQIVRNGITERFQFLVYGLQLCCPFLNPSLEGFVETPYVLFRGEELHKFGDIREKEHSRISILGYLASGARHGPASVLGRRWLVV